MTGRKVILLPHSSGVTAMNMFGLVTKLCNIKMAPEFRMILHVTFQTTVVFYCIKNKAPILNVK